MAESLDNLKLELRRGCLVLAVLAQLQQEHYGYTLRRALAEGGVDMDEGTLYPLLRRLETQGLLASEWRLEDKRNKRFYRLSATGVEVLAQLLGEWRQLNASLDRILESAAKNKESKMELLERYLQAIGTFLPRKNSTDILRELREDILSQVEEKEAELRRPLTAQEQEDVIRAHGHPIAVAARYSQQRYLIGPALFPFYWITLLVAVAVALVARSAVVLITLLIDNNNLAHATSLFAGIPGTLLAIFAAITLSFAILEHLVSAYKISGKWKWSPSSLPRLYRTRRTVSRAESAAGLIFGIAAAIWWQAIPGAPFLILGPGSLFLHPAAIWHALQLPILLVIVSRALLCGYDLLRPHVSTIREWVEVAFKVIEIALVAIILSAGTWVIAKPGAGHIADPVNESLRYTFAVLLAILGFQVARKCYRIYQASKTTASETLNANAAGGQPC